jgi:IS30 family transposase
MARTFLSEEQKERIAELREKGLSYGNIGRRIGCSPSTACWHCLRLGAEPPKCSWPLWDQPKGPLVLQRGNHMVRRFTAEEDTQLRVLVVAGIGIAEIGRQMNRRTNSIIGRLRALARRDEREEVSPMKR